MLTLVLTAGLVAGFASLVFGQAAPPPAPAPVAADGPSVDPSVSAVETKPAAKQDKNASRPPWRNTRRLQETKDIIGTRVTDASGEELGQIDQLLIDPKTGRITHAVIGSGGVLGVGKTEVVVTFSALKRGPMHEDGKADITMSRATLDRAPLYDIAVALGGTAPPPAASPATSGAMRRSQKDARSK